MRFGPDACLRVADAIRRYLASAPGGAGDLPAGVDIAGQGRPQFLGVAGIQVNLVLRAIQPEKNCALCFATVEVVDKEGLYFLRYACLRSCSLSWRSIAQHMSSACTIGYRPGRGMSHGLALKFSGSSAVRGLIPPMLVNVPE